jgi:hypothetical protein
MDISQSYYQLVRDAVAQRRMGGQGCFVWNTDSLRLREIGEVVLPDIEQVLLREVLTNSPSPSEVFSSRFPGVLSVLISYFEIAKDTGHLARAAGFFRVIHGSLRVEAMRAINNVWLLRQPPTPIPEAFMEAVREIAEYGSGELRQVASWLMERAKDETH